MVYGCLVRGASVVQRTEPGQYTAEAQLMQSIGWQVRTALRNTEAGHKSDQADPVSQYHTIIHKLMQRTVFEEPHVCELQLHDVRMRLLCSPVLQGAIHFLGVSRIHSTTANTHTMLPHKEHIPNPSSK
jgi:hypothetical protein